MLAATYIKVSLIVQSVANAVTTKHTQKVVAIDVIAVWLHALFLVD